MEDIQIKKLWQKYNMKLEENLSLNRKNAEDITKLKVKSSLLSMKPIKIFAILIGIVWVIFVDVLIINLFTSASLFFLISAGIQVLLTKLAIGIYLYQLILIHQVDLTGPILAVQEKIARLKSSTLWAAKLFFLQLPVWTTFYLNKSMLENGSAALFVIQIFITISFTFAAVWLFLNINKKNMDKNWFRLIFNGSEWNPLIKSLDMLNQIDDYKSANT